MSPDVERVRQILNGQRNRAALAHIVMHVMAADPDEGLTATEIAQRTHDRDATLLDLHRDRVLEKCGRLIELEILERHREIVPTPCRGERRPGRLYRISYRMNRGLESSKPARAACPPPAPPRARRGRG